MLYCFSLEGFWQMDSSWLYCTCHQFDYDFPAKIYCQVLANLWYLKCLMRICLVAPLNCPAAIRGRTCFLRLGFMTCWKETLIKIPSFTSCKLFDYAFKFLFVLLSVIYFTAIFGSTLVRKQTWKNKCLDLR